MGGAVFFTNTRAAARRVEKTPHWVRPESPRTEDTRVVDARAPPRTPERADDGIGADGA
uniref:Uncharacterized protein n=1 Tax=Human betaherpesvirus 6 TaxID=10368 RepID=A0A5P9V3Y3_9BETA|nr:hypothetical protein [Human betaherpesvirus 6]